MHTELKPAFDSSSQMVLLKQAHLLTDKCSPPWVVLGSWLSGQTVLNHDCLLIVNSI